MRTNKAAEELICVRGWGTSAPVIIGYLIEAGFIQPDPLTSAEQIVEATRRYIGVNEGYNAKQVFTCAAGWDSNSWGVVLGKHIYAGGNDTLNIFHALVILAKEAGIEL